MDLENSSSVENQNNISGLNAVKNPSGDTFFP
jgi:hypothetical protein